MILRCPTKIFETALKYGTGPDRADTILSVRLLILGWGGFLSRKPNENLVNLTKLVH